MALILETVVPIFGFVALGYFLARSPVLSAEGARGLSQFVFYCAIPALLFRAGSRLFGAEPLEPGLLVAFYGAALPLYLGLVLWLWRGRGRALPEAAMAGMCAVFTNTVMLGLPLAQALYGDRGLLLTSSVIAVNGLLYYALTTTLIELGQGRGGSPARQIWSGLKSLVRNPILLGMAAGLAWGATGLAIPGPAARMIDLLAAAAPPVALAALGAALAGFRLAGDTLALLILLAALPVGVNPFLLASRYRVYVNRSGSIVLLTTAASVLTLALLVALLAPPAASP